MPNLKHFTLVYAGEILGGFREWEISGPILPGAMSTC